MNEVRMILLSYRIPVVYLLRQEPEGWIFKREDWPRAGYLEHQNSKSAAIVAAQKLADLRGELIKIEYPKPECMQLSISFS